MALCRLPSQDLSAHRLCLLTILAVKRTEGRGWAAATMIILICAGWYRNGMIRRELTHSRSVGFGFPYHIVSPRVLLSKPWASTPCSVHCQHVALFLFLLHAYSSPRNRKLMCNSTLGDFALYWNAAWAEDRAMLGSNPSADPGPKTEAGCPDGVPRFAFLTLGIGTKAINPGGLGAGPQLQRLAE